MGYMDNLDHGLNAVRYVDVKIYDTHNLDSVIGYPEDLDHSFD